MLISACRVRPPAWQRHQYRTDNTWALFKARPWRVRPEGQAETTHLIWTYILTLIFLDLLSTCCVVTGEQLRRCLELTGRLPLGCGDEAQGDTGGHGEVQVGAISRDFISMRADHGLAWLNLYRPKLLLLVTHSVRAFGAAAASIATLCLLSDLGQAESRALLVTTYMLCRQIPFLISSLAVGVFPRSCKQLW